MGLPNPDPARSGWYAAEKTRILLDDRSGFGDHGGMGRPLRTQIGGLVYHVLNRANRRAELFGDAGDYAAFLRTLA